MVFAYRPDIIFDGYQFQEKDMPFTAKVQSRFRNSRFIAVDRADKGRVVAEGRSAQKVAMKAERTGKPFTMAFVAPAGKKYIY